MNELVKLDPDIPEARPPPDMSVTSIKFWTCPLYHVALSEPITESNNR